MSRDIKDLEAEINYLKAENEGLLTLVLELRQMLREIQALVGKNSEGDA